MGLRSSGHNEGALCVALPGKGLATGALPQCVCVRGGGGGMRALGRPVCPDPARVWGAQPRLLSGASTRESRGPGPRARAPVRPPDRLQFHSCTAPPHCPLSRPVRRGWGGKGGVRGQGPRQHRRQRRSGAPRGGGGLCAMARVDSPHRRWVAGGPPFGVGCGPRGRGTAVGPSAKHHRRFNAISEGATAQRPSGGGGGGGVSGALRGPGRPTSERVSSGTKWN